MTKTATPKAIEAYREKLLTNPATFGQQLRRVRENLRERSEVLFIDRDLTAADKAVDEETREAELERIDEQILRVGARIDDLDAQIEAHNKAHPDAELAAKLMEAPPPGAAMSRQHRRQLQRATSKSEAKRLKILGAPAEGAPTAPDPAAKAPEHSHPPQTVPAPEAPPSAGETPKAEG